MKKTVAVSLLFFSLFLLLFGCKKSSPDSSLQKSFEGMTGYTAKVTVTADELSYSFDFSSTGKDAYSLKITSPASLSGVGIEKKGNNLSMSYGGFSVPLDFLPSKMYNGIDKLTEVLMSIETIVSKLPVTAKSETTLEIGGKANDSLSVSILFDLKTLLPLSVTTKVNGSELKAEITEFKLLK